MRATNPARQANVLGAFESMARRHPQRTCFTFVDAEGGQLVYSYREVRMFSASLARYLQQRGVDRGSLVSVDLPNDPLCILLILAAAYSGFTLVIINNRLSESEKLSQILELERSTGMRCAYRVSEQNSNTLYEQAGRQLTGVFLNEGADTAARSGSRASLDARLIAAEASARSTRALGRARPGREARLRQEQTERQDAIENIIHFAERSARLFARDAQAAIFFTSGSTGKPKAVPLSWENLCDAASASNRELCPSNTGLWQVALPLFHVGGFQVVIRSLLANLSFVLYRRFDARRLLGDVAPFRATHVSVVDKMLQDMLDVAEALGPSSTEAEALAAYQCILLGGSAPNPRMLERASSRGLRVHVSYGMTETSSHIAQALVTSEHDGTLKLLSGYTVRIVDPDEEGFGSLAVKGPGLTRGYLNTHTPRTIDGFFLTGDTAAFEAGCLYLRERTKDMFVSGGENIYPAQIRAALLRLPGVRDAYVFGAPDKTWGWRPVAFVECASGAYYGPDEIKQALAPHLSKLYIPREVYLCDYLPRTGIGKTDRVAIEKRYEQRIDVDRVVLYRIRLPFKTPFKTARGTLNYRESIIVEVRDAQGRTGLGECVAFSTDWYLPETLDEDERILKEVLAPALLRQVYLHPSEASKSFSSLSSAQRYPLARGAIEPALWDLYGKISQKPLWQLIGGRVSGQASVPVGAVVGIGSLEDTLARVEAQVNAGCKRIKLKVMPGCLRQVQEVRGKYPQLMLCLDANQSFREENLDELIALDAIGAAWIEEPLNPNYFLKEGPHDILARLARLQRRLRTPICVDESITKPEDAARALRYQELRCFALKIAKWGGILPALEFAANALERGCTVWMGGMYDTGISRRLHAAFETLPGVDAPGDLSAPSEYFPVDISDPSYEVCQGMVQPNSAQHPFGIGCVLNQEALNSVLVKKTVVH